MGFRGSNASGGRIVLLPGAVWAHIASKLSDPRNCNHKSLATANRNFKVASFASRNRSKIAVSQSQKSHRAKKIAAIRNHTLVVATISGGFPDLCDDSETLEKPGKTGGPRVQRVGFRGCFLSRSDFFELRLQSLAICDFEVAAIRVTKLSKWPLWAHLLYSVSYNVSELRRACFRQARVTRAVLPPGALFRARPFALPPGAPRSHMRPLPHLGVSDKF